MYNLEYYKKEKNNILKNCFFTKRQQLIFNALIDGTKPSDMYNMFGCCERTVRYEMTRIKKKIEDYRNGENNQYYYVYIHIFPNGKKYAGCTQNTINRWGKDGLPYCRNMKMYEDIIKYGWENIKHEIILKTTSEVKARELENKIIKIFELNNEKNGYNITT